MTNYLILITIYSGTMPFMKRTSFKDPAIYHVLTLIWILEKTIAKSFRSYKCYR